MSTITKLDPMHRRRRAMRRAALNNLPPPPKKDGLNMVLWTTIRDSLVQVYRSSRIHGFVKHDVFIRGVRQMAKLSSAA